MFIHNTATDDAGSVFALSGATLELVNCVFFENVSPDKAGALYNRTDSTSKVINCTFVGNSGLYGGAIFIW
jgi:hypothetical protein